MVVAGWTGVGVGGGVLLSGAIVHVLAAVKADEASDIPNLPQNLGRFQAKRDESRTMEIAAWSMYGVGAAVLGTGVVLLVVDAVRGSGAGQGRASVGVSGLELQPWAAPGAAGVQWQTQF